MPHLNNLETPLDFFGFTAFHASQSNIIVGWTAHSPNTALDCISVLMTTRIKLLLLSYQCTMRNLSTHATPMSSQKESRFRMTVPVIGVNPWRLGSHEHLQILGWGSFVSASEDDTLKSVLWTSVCWIARTQDTHSFQAITKGPALKPGLVTPQFSNQNPQHTQFSTQIDASGLQAGLLNVEKIGL